MKKNYIRYLCIPIALTLLCTLFSACSGENKQAEANTTTPYDKTVPASVSSESGIGRFVSEPSPDARTIVIDPGHGFVDVGCGDGIYSDGTLEKDITLAISKLLDESLRRRGYNTIITHDGENIPAADTNGNKIFSASERVAYVNGLECDYVISVHVNSLDSDSTVEGMHIYYKQNSVKENDWGMAIAQDIASAIDTGINPNKSTLIKDGSAPATTFAMTRDVVHASSLLEVGFVTNPTDAANMIDPEWQEKLAEAIADGIDKFFTGLDGER